MNKAIKASTLSELSDSLSNEELGAAVRLLVRILERGEPLPMRNIHIAAGVTKESWDAMADAVLSFFDVSDNRLNVAHWLHSIQSASTSTKKSTRKKQEDLFLTVAEIVTTPAPKSLQKKQQENVASVRSQVFEKGTKHFEANGFSSTAAKKAVARLCKTYDENKLLEAFADAIGAAKYEEEPYGDIVKRVRRLQGTVKADGPGGSAKGNRTIVSAAHVGLSEHTAQAIRDRNSRFGNFRLGTTLLDDKNKNSKT